MDGDGDSGLKLAATLEAFNAQAVPQLRNLENGPLIVGALEALQATIERGESITATVLQLRLQVDGKLYRLVVNAVVAPP